MLAGVCGGIGEYFEIDPTLVRLVFVLTTFFGGFGLLAYLLLALVVPEEGSSKQAFDKDEIHKNAQELADKIKKEAKTMAHEIKTEAEKQSKEAKKAGEDWAKTSSDWTGDHNHTHRRGHYGFGIFLLLIGFVFLLSNLGIFSLSHLLVFWPIILIVFGLSFLIG